MAEQFQATAAPPLPSLTVLVLDVPFDNTGVVETGDVLYVGNSRPFCLECPFFLRKA